MPSVVAAIDERVESRGKRPDVQLASTPPTAVGSDIGAKEQRRGVGLKAAIYARVSTSDQNCEMQLRELREYAHVPPPLEMERAFCR